MSNNGTSAAGAATATKPLGAEPIIEQGVVLYRPDQRTMAVPDADATDLAVSLQAQFPDDLKNNKPLAMVLAKAAIAYNLDPFLNEITVYRGKPFFPLEGRLRIAQNQDTFQGVFARPATEEERKAWGCASRPEIILWRAEAYRSDWVDPKTGEMRPVIGWGEVNINNDQNPVAKQKPNQQAEVRATKRALRSLYNTPLPFRDLPDEVEGDRDADRVQAAAWISPDGRILDQRPGGNLLTPGQNAAIHAVCNELGIDENRRHELVHAMFGKDNAGELNESDAAAFLEWLGIQATRKAPALIEDPRAEAYTVVDKAAGKRFHTAAAAASFTPPRIVDAEPERSAPVLTEGMILEGTSGQKYVVENGQLVPFVEAPRATEAPAAAPASDPVPEETEATDVAAEDIEESAATEQETTESTPAEAGEPATVETPADPPAMSGEDPLSRLPKSLATKLTSLKELASAESPQPWWQDGERVAENRAGLIRYLKGPGLKYSPEDLTTLLRLLTLAFDNYDPGNKDAETDLSPAWIACLQMHKPEVVALREGIQQVRLEGLLD